MASFALKWLALLALSQGSAASSDGARRPVPVFELDLDASPSDRFREVLTHFNASIWDFYKSIDNFAIRDVLKTLAAKRGPEPDILQKEIEAGSALLGVPLYGLSALQMLYELGDMEIPIGPNITIPVPWTAPGCTGILANNKNDGMVYHARNQDFSPAKYLQNLVYTGVWKRGGKELYKAQMIAGFFMPLTGLKSGPNGYSYETNTRYRDAKKGLTDFWKNLFTEKRPLNMWSVRQAFEQAATYEDFVKQVSTVKLVAPIYMVISGVKKGTILARDPDTIAHQMILGQPNYECREDYIIITNFDYFFHDIREWFDPTGGKGIGHPRRTAAQKILNASSVLTPEVLFETIDDFEVRAKDTIFQVIMNVETGLWNASLPACTTCPQMRQAAEAESSLMII